ncbi:MAG: winged helix-turn-helix transcriptional regulator [Promethearchaeota archaeon]|jgi:predicted transcriptional regulator
MQIEESEQEKLILNVVEEYLNKNRYFDMSEILPFIVSRFRIASVDINIRRIEEILRILVKKNLVVEGSKLLNGDILKIEKRKLIYEHILENPGIYFNRILKELNISNHVVVWHLNVLQKFNFIKKEKIENHDIYFDSNFDVKSSKFAYLTSKDKSKKIINYLKNNDFGITKTQLSKNLRIHPNTISKYLKALEKFDVVVKKKVLKRVIYFLNESFLKN